MFVPISLAAEERQDDVRSLGRLFSDELAADALHARLRSQRMPSERRYAYLRQQVLPQEADRIRIAIGFLPTNPSPPVLEQYGSVDLPLLDQSGKRRVPSGGALVSPAIDLVELAGELGKLNELKTAVSRRSPAGSEQIKARSAMLILISAAEGDYEQYASRLNEFMTLVRESPVTDIERGPEMVVLWSATQSAQTRALVRDFLLLMREQMKFGTYHHREKIKRHVFSLHHLLDELTRQQESLSSGPVDARMSEHWHVVSRDRAVTRGNGYPNAFWTTSPPRARHLSSHGADYLYYNTPLRGNFEVEGDFSTFGYREIRLAVGTIWVGPVYDHKRIQWGDFRGQKPDIPINPPFTKMNDWMRVRTVVRDGVRTTYINGRNVLTSRQGPDSEPWIAVVSPWHTSGEMQNVRITGNPEIPHEIGMIANAGLPGWLAYYGESVGSSGDMWSLRQTRPSTLIERLNPFRNDSADVLTGGTSAAPRGSYQESLLRYHRPMVEDGTIEYEFFYSPGEFAVFPALDRCCFLFDSERAGVHWLTDGKYDRTGLDPANFTSVTSEKSIPLQDNDWNQVRLNLMGDAVEIALNGEAILTRQLEPENLRTFGLFHYADRTTAMVRNLRWRGEWPKELPAPREQILADFALEEELARGPELRTVFEHDFSEGLPQDRIWVAGHNWQDYTEQRPAGLRMNRPGGLYEKNSLSLPFGLQGDFDVTWEFADLQSNAEQGGNGNLHLLILLDDAAATECRLYRKQWLDDKSQQVQFAQSSIFYAEPDGQTRYTFPAKIAEESTGGKLRLVRRGTQMSFLYAEGDSDFFRLVDRATVPGAPVKFGGIRGIIETHQEGETSAVWKRVIVRAESVPGELQTHSLTVKELDEQRSLLPQAAVLDLNRDPTPGRLDLTGEPQDVTREDNGWIIRQPGYDSWRATWLKPQVGLQGDFDITLNLDVLKLEQAQRGAESTVYLHARFDTARLLAIEIKYSIAANTRRCLEIQMSTPGRDGGNRYDELKHQRADEVTQLRLARRGAFAYLIARRSGDDEPEVLGRVKVGEADVPLGSFGVAVHTGGAGQETIVRFKSLEIRAEQFK